MIAERIQARLTDIDTEIGNVQTAAQAKVAALRKEKAALTQMQQLLSPQLLQAVQALQAAGLLKDL